MIKKNNNRFKVRFGVGRRHRGPQQQHNKDIDCRYIIHTVIQQQWLETPDGFIKNGITVSMRERSLSHSTFRRAVRRVTVFYTHIPTNQSGSARHWADALRLENAYSQVEKSAAFDVHVIQQYQYMHVLAFNDDNTYRPTYVF